MWFDGATDAEISIRVHSEQSETAVKELRDYGFATIRRLISRDLCRAAFDAYTAFTRFDAEAPNFRDACGLHGRFTNLHQILDPIERIAGSEYLHTVLDDIFQNRSCVRSTLLFDRGSAQATHVDGPYFSTAPRDMFVGVWIALEPVVPESGPLFYWESGHALSIDPVSIAERWKSDVALDELWSDEEWWMLYNGKSDPRFPVSLWNYFNKSVEQEAASAKLEVKRALPDIGDVLIWHPRLPHGGSVIDNPEKSRRSLVVHAVPETVPVLGPDHFHGRPRRRSRKPALTSMKYTTRRTHDIGYRWG